MVKLDMYLRSIEKFGASGAVLTSGQAVTLRFPTGDRHATQVTPHDQLVQLVRELAPPAVYESVDKGRPVRIEVESGGRRYSVHVTPRAGVWQVTIEALTGSGATPLPSSPSSPPPLARTGRPQSNPAIPVASAAGGTGAAGAGPASVEVSLERGQYEGSSQISSLLGGAVLDQLTRAARAASASDLYLTAGTAPVHRIGGELIAAGSGVIDGEVIARELGVVAPPDARAAWTEKGTAMFTYGDGKGRVRVTLARDQRGPSAALRMLPDEPPSFSQLGLAGAGAVVEGWLSRRGLIVIAGPSGSGKTVTLGALVRALGERRRRVVAIEDPIELVHASAWISQRAVGEHVASVSTGVACAMNEGADAIVIGRVCSEATARGVVEAVSGGHLVLTTAVAPAAGVALDRMIAHLPADQRELAHGLLFAALLGTIQPVPAKGGERTFEIVAPGRGAPGP
ncbi:MAG TPA: ATPase, T2SS/T4P/T4SS family [Kofleriaceae bacterium]|nr:ATPase, T2SS/T4P/T4SS family [Kofleriaceae bacterium]